MSFKRKGQRQKKVIILMAETDLNKSQQLISKNLKELIAKQKVSPAKKIAAYNAMMQVTFTNPDIPLPLGMVLAREIVQSQLPLVEKIIPEIENMEDNPYEWAF